MSEQEKTPARPTDNASAAFESEGQALAADADDINVLGAIEKRGRQGGKDVS